MASKKTDIGLFLDELLDEYDDVDNKSLRKNAKQSDTEKSTKWKNYGDKTQISQEGSSTLTYSNPNLKFERETRKKFKKNKLIVLPPLKICSLCNFESSSHAENLAHWSVSHSGASVEYACDWDNCKSKAKSVLQVKKHRRQHLIESGQLKQ